MDNLTRGIRVLHQNAIRIEADGRVLYFDPYGVQGAPHDADYIFVTHDHYDHFSPEDIGRVSKAGTTLVVPESARAAAEAVGLAVLPVQVGQSAALPGVSFRTVPAYNLNKKFHPRAKDWVGYTAELGGGIYYIAGDTDATPEARAVRCDVALLPIGGTYTMDAEEAADLARAIRPRVVVPTHYSHAAAARQFRQLLEGVVPCQILLENL